MAKPPRIALFSRVVIGFCDTSTPTASLEAVANFARLIETELLGVFIEDSGLMEWSSAPLFRQLVSPARTSRPATTEQLAAEFAAASAMARRRLARIASRLGLQAHFEVERTSIAALRFKSSAPGDLLVVIEPADPMARHSYPFTGLLQSVAISREPVLYLPRRIIRQTGPVVAITQHRKDSTRRIAARLASLLGEELISLQATEISAARKALYPIQERLIVLNRQSQADPLLFASLAAERMVPVLITSPDPNLPNDIHKRTATPGS